jgi:tetratricopeptide (TPR) repeat protein
MSDVSREFTKRQGDALALVSEGRTEEAHAAFEQLLTDSAAADDDGLPEVCGAFAALKHQLGRFDEALALYERALHEARRLSGDAHSIAVYCYFLGDFLVKLGRASEAIEVLHPAVDRDERSDRFLLVPLAKAQWILGIHDEARSTAQRAIGLARTDDQRERASESLKHILGGSDAA